MPQSATLPTPQTSEKRRLLEQANGALLQHGRYRLERTIGKGSFGKVKQAWDLNSGRRVAIKFIARSSIKKPQHIDRIRREINLTSLLRHDNIVRLWDTFETTSDIVLVQELVPGKDLFDVIVARGKLTVAESRSVLRQLASALQYLHTHNVVHRDLKPENVMLVGGEAMGVAKLIDFGFANLYDPAKTLGTNCGSPLYAAPEIVKGVKYVGPEVDCWSLGVVLYCMLTGSLPFEDENLKGLYEKICKGDFDLAPVGEDADAKDLLRGLICVPSERRMTMKQVLQHPWLAHHDFHNDIVKPRTIRPPWRDEIIRRLEQDFGIEDPRRQLWNATAPAYSLYGLIEDELREKQARGRITEDELREKQARGLSPYSLTEGELRGKQGSPYSMTDIVVTNEPWTLVERPPPNERVFGERGFGDRNYGESGFRDRNYGESGFRDRDFGDRNFGEQRVYYTTDKTNHNAMPGAFRPTNLVVMEEHDASFVPRSASIRQDQAANADNDANSSGNFVLQAAASVMNRFRKLRELAK